MSDEIWRIEDTTDWPKTVPVVVYTEEGRKVVGEAVVGSDGKVEARIEHLAYNELIADVSYHDFSIAPAYEPRLPQANYFDQPPHEVLERLRLHIHNLDKEA